MKAGRELDALIAEKVMGWKKYNAPDGTEFWDNGIFCGGKWMEEWNPSTSIADAWLVVEKFDDYKVGKTWCRLYKEDENYFVHSCDSPSQAICLAALKAVGVEVEG